MVCLGLAMGGVSGPGTGFSGGRDRWHHLQNLHHLAERWSPKRCPAVYWLGLLGSAPNVCCGFGYAYSLSRHGWPIPQSKDKKTQCVYQKFMNNFDKAVGFLANAGGASSSSGHR
uniref:HDC03201 n=1 Tax=Drosophila melanogaster TaxID=7227 RepID=Q6IH63_DROME|nr:TPA_inf: HDC03201 [Drosophila melanogaster]